MFCRECGKSINGKPYPNDTCQTCYNYFRKGGMVHPIPEHGRVRHDAEGKVICHICGRSYTRLGSHIKESHSMTIKEYKEEFGLCASAKTTEENYHDNMKRLAYNNNMDKRLIETGRNTRFKKGDCLRKGKQVRLQEILDKRDRRFKQG